MNFKVFFSTLVFLSLTSSLCAQTKVIAHRGFWKTENSAQNSISSLKNAQNLKGVYGSECDVYITADGVLVMNHDSTAHGSDIVIETAKYAEIKDILLGNGEVMPTFQQYLNQAKKNKLCKLVVEIKSHNEKSREDAAVEEILKQVKKAGLEKQVEYISFSKNIVKQLIALNPKAKVQYLNGELSPKELKELGCSGLDYNFAVMKKNPHWFKEAKELGLTVNVWTVNKAEQIAYLLEQGADFITTDEPELCIKMINEKK